MSPRDLITVLPPVERALLVGAPRKGTAEARDVGEHLDELARLADTAGAEVVGRVVQIVASPNPETWIGPGKVDEVKSRIAESGATMVIFDEDLSPRQGKHLEDELKVRVMDRTELILDIFALRARSREARMQVALAQSEYLLPRLTRMWAHLSRIRGGIGLRGPGETQLEVDRRLIRHRITQLRAKLEDVAAHRQRVRARVKDRGVRRVALVGYTNAGKSSLLRALTGQNAHVEDRLFATLDTLSRETVVNGTRLRITDTVGFIRKLPHGLVASFRATLEEALDADVLVHVVDVSHPAWEDQARVVGEVIDEAGGHEEGKPGGRGSGSASRILMALNKVDALDGADRRELERLAADRGWRAVQTSAVTLEGVPELRSALTEKCD